MLTLKMILAAGAVSGLLVTGTAMACHGTASAGTFHAAHTAGTNAHHHHDKSVRGVVSGLRGNKLTLSHRGKGAQPQAATIGGNTKIHKGHKAATVADLKENQTVVITFADNSDEAASIDIVSGA